MVSSGTLLAVLGGSWHAFETFAAWLRPLSKRIGCNLRVAFDTAPLERLVADAVDVVLLYNCLDERSEVSYSEAQLVWLRAWVEGGGRLLALHGATVAARKHASLRALLGGAFVDHPPIGTLEVRCVGSAHPTVADIGPFFIHDELYRHDLEPSAQVHLVASIGQETQPVAWTQQVKGGKVAYFALGHDESAWQHVAFERIVVQSLTWLLEQR